MSNIRNIIKIDNEKCTGCGLCIPNCPEGAIQIIDNKARLISDLFCDGLGACIGHCPEGAITVEQREAEPYDEKKVMENIVIQGENTIKAHLIHLKSHGEMKFYNEAVGFLKEHNIPVPAEINPEPVHACPGSLARDFREKEPPIEKDIAENKPELKSQLRQWPIQLKLVPVNAPYFDKADILIAADCVPFSYAGFHEKLLKGKILIIGCPKLDDKQLYLNKLSAIFSGNDIKSVTVVHMEVPCCFGLIKLVENAVDSSGKEIPVKTVEISIKGEIKNSII
jgi:ferredoxin